MTVIFQDMKDHCLNRREKGGSVFRRRVVSVYTLVKTRQKWRKLHRKSQLFHKRTAPGVLAYDGEKTAIK